MQLYDDFFKNVQEIKDIIECEEESKDVSHSGSRTDNESINESEMSSF